MKKLRTRGRFSFISEGIDSFRALFRLLETPVDQEVIQPTDEEQTIVGSERRGLDSGPLEFQKTPMSNAVRATGKKEMRPPSCKTKALSAVLTLLLSVSEAGHPSYCQIWQADIIKSEGVVKVSRNYKGLWVSEKCEIHPGPHFVLRRYHIHHSGHFTLIRYHYQDPWCTVATFSVSAVGNFVPSPEKATSSSASWVVPGGIELDYTLRKVTIVPFTSKSADRLSQKVNESCPGAVVSEWKPLRKYRLFGYDRKGVRKSKVRLDIGSIDNSDCTAALGISFHELQLMRLEYRIPLNFIGFKRMYDDKSPDDTTRRYYTYLFLGAEGFPTGSRPTYYQMPLVPSQTSQCAACLAVAKATLMSPPILSSGPFNTDMLSTDLGGQWISMRCEVRPYGLFLRRIFIFDAQDNRWQAQHSYYKDPHCHNPMFILSAKGIYFRGLSSKIVPDATEYDFHIQEAFLTPEDIQFANNLNGLYTCGTGSNWKVGERGNLTRTGGCRELGIVVPSMELDLVRFERSKADMVFLYLGETAEDKRRPTSFQPSLVRCSTPDDKVAEDFFLNYNELRPLPLVSGSSMIHSFLIDVLKCFFCYVFLKFFDIGIIR
ncbi:protein APCDD1 [Nephila pilipes]|uniref:Protein APCDD1 n=1 Tax=Nephila pilipes TaxID=299642 RepID=A0A8X6MP20_NEPPI|nr:protein APCDD1 [Nephila pilipes]